MTQNLSLPKNAVLYQVGGCVRDALLGVPSTDTDFVVVGVSPQEMIDAGFQQVGADFPVFLHPVTHDEYALARTERKNGQGYHGFSTYSAPDVTLEEDLWRRDFTMNAMAQNPTTGSIIDPFNGKKDLEQSILRHVGPAFSEDPVRVLRGARFAAKYSLTFADDTWALMNTLVESGEMASLVHERVRVEFEKGFKSFNPSKMWSALDRLGALPMLVPPEMANAAVYGLLELLSKDTDSAEVWGTLMHAAFPNADSTKYKELMLQYKYPKGCVYIAQTLQLRANISENFSTDQLVKYWTTSDARRQKKSWDRVQDLCFQLGQRTPSMEQWAQVDAICRGIDESAVVQTIKSLGLHVPSALPNALFVERCARVAHSFPQYPCSYPAKEQSFPDGAP